VAIIPTGIQFSPWNLFYKVNSGDTTLPDYPKNLKISYGSAPVLEVFSARHKSDNSTLYVAWSTEIPTGCSGDDLVYVYRFADDGHTLIKISPDGITRSAGGFNKFPTSSSDYVGKPIYFFTHNIDGNFSPSFGLTGTVYNLL